MISFFIDFLTCLSALVRSRYNLGLEILVLRQQLGVLRRKHPRPRLQLHDPIFWILLRRLWPAWRNALVIVKPETLSPGIGLAFGCSGAIDRGPSLGRPKMPGFELSSGEWRARIPAGALPEFTVSF